MGFPRQWCSWVQGVLASARSSVLVNGAPTFEFQYHKGRRQGDPLSPFLFLIVMENLSCMLDAAKEAGAVHDIQTPNGGPNISHLLYADDAIILERWNKEDIVNVVRILLIFHLGSGQKINLAKPNMYGIGVEAS
ncbi:uncharacterized mitochondrial protein AtMg01250-like [Helianthus annuus]|uniref:uncharacterized mitochondrial protein AtMg01250-like n=1 Tax=Helianthus annuus TaxID=4232 RepID=UPI000B8EF2C0|nr:uncharacterized mitochondrial protein AtMg01250-like [Helianthus annuus]